jgi:hypothetical protein
VGLLQLKLPRLKPIAYGDFEIAAGEKGDR